MTMVAEKRAHGKEKTTLHDALQGIGTFSQRISKSYFDLIKALGEPKLKVALISFYYQRPSISGVGIHVWNLAKHIADHGCEVHVFCSGVHDGVYREHGVIVHAVGRVLIPLMDDFSRKRLEYDLFESGVIKDIIRENTRKKFDVIHTHQGAVIKAAFVIKKIYGMKWIYTFHAIEKLRIRKLGKEEKHFQDLISWVEQTVNYSDGAIFVSRDLFEEGRKHYKLGSSIVIPNGIDLEMFSYHPITAKNVLYVGRFSKEKGIGSLPKIISSVMAVDGSTFTAVCPYNALGGELKRIRRLISALEKKHPGRIKIIDKPQDPEAVRDLYRDCQVYIQPSKYESFGLCVLEAMATGRPVVAPDIGGMPEVIGDSGFIVDDIEGLIRTVTELLDNRDECVLVGKKANARAKGFDWDIIAQDIIKYYRGLKNE
ncbi:MAG: glycosyltransferase family 4 protein [archaeon]